MDLRKGIRQGTARYLHIVSVCRAVDTTAHVYEKKNERITLLAANETE